MSEIQPFDGEAAPADLVRQLERILGDTRRGPLFVTRMDDYEFSILAAGVRTGLLTISDSKTSKRFDQRFTGNGKPSQHQQFLQRMRDKWAQAVRTPELAASQDTLASPTVKTSLVLDQAVTSHMQHTNGAGQWASEAPLTAQQQRGLLGDIRALLHDTFDGNTVGWYEATVRRPRRELTGWEEGRLALTMALYTSVSMGVGAAAADLQNSVTPTTMLTPAAVMATMTAAGLISKFSKNGLRALDMFDTVRDVGRTRGLERHDQADSVLEADGSHVLGHYDIDRDGNAQRQIVNPALRQAQQSRSRARSTARSGPSHLRSA